MANSVDSEQTAPIEAVCSGSALFASILNWSVMLGNYLKQATSADMMHFFLGALRFNLYPATIFGPENVVWFLHPSLCCICSSALQTRFFHGSKYYEKVSMLRKYHNHTLQTNPPSP